MDFAVENGVYVCTFAADNVIIQFERLTQHRDGLKAELTVFAVGATDDPNVPLHQAEMRLNGTNARRDVARYVAGRSLREVDWTGLIETAAVRVLSAYREGDPPILLREAVAPPNSGLLLPPLVRDGEPTILFGDGGVGKSMLALAIALSLHADRGDVLGLTPVATKRVLYLDWEANDWTQRDRMQRLIGEPMPDVLYRRCVGSARSGRAAEEVDPNAPCRLPGDRFGRAGGGDRTGDGGRCERLLRRAGGSRRRRGMRRARHEERDRAGQAVRLDLLAQRRSIDLAREEDAGALVERLQRRAVQQEEQQRTAVCAPRL